MNKLPVLGLMGPTASGKTRVALDLACDFPIEVISVDSALVYRGLDIGTAKPTLAERARVPHHLIDVQDPSKPYSAARFIREAHRCIQEIHGRSRIPLLIGGTMLYFKALFQGLDELPRAQYGLRSEIYDAAACLGWQALHEELAQVDPVSAKRIHPNDHQRLVRALEVYRQTGRSLTDLTHVGASRVQLAPAQVLDCLSLFAIVPEDRHILHQRINSRFDEMLALGFEQEVRGLFARADLNHALPAMRSVGYRQMWSYLAGDVSHADMIEQAKAASRQLAKRQLTWLRGWDRQGLPKYRGFTSPESAIAELSGYLLRQMPNFF